MRNREHDATVGVAENGNSAVLVTLAPPGKLLDRRNIDLTDGLPTHPHHHEGSWAVGRYLNTPGARRLSLSEAVALVERVRESAPRGVRLASILLSRESIWTKRRRYVGLQPKFGRSNISVRKVGCAFVCG